MNDVRLISSEMDEKSTFGLSFRGNSYSSKKADDKLHFVMNGKEIFGIEDFNRLIGAEDSYENIDYK